LRNLPHKFSFIWQGLLAKLVVVFETIKISLIKNIFFLSYYTNFWKLCFLSLNIQAVYALNILRIFTSLFIVIILIIYAPTFWDVGYIQLNESGMENSLLLSFSGFKVSLKSKEIPWAESCSASIERYV
jgi:hypothetical protein